MSTPEEDEAWRTIVENYGERPQFPEEQARAQQRPEPAPRRETEHPELHEDTAAHFVPQPAPPVVLPRGRRGAAWFGVLGVPVLVIIGVVLGIQLPGWVNLGLLVWFVGGFVYLVVTMRDDSDGWDDGAVV